MGVRLQSLVGIATAAIASLGFMGNAIAQERSQDPPDTVEIQPIDEAFIDAFYTRGGSFFENREFPRAFTWFLGPFPENDITGDARSLHRVYNIVIEQQGQSDPFIRTPDLANPFDSSLLLTPPLDVRTISEQVPFAPPPIIVAPPQAQPVRPQQPVPALY